MSGIKIHFRYLVSADCTTACSASEKNGLSKGIHMINKTVYIRSEPWKLTACLRTTHSFLNWKSKSTIMLWQCLTSTHSLHGIGSFNSLSISYLFHIVTFARNHWQRKQKALYLSVNEFSTKVPVGDTIFTSPTGDGTVILRGHPSHTKV